MKFDLKKVPITLVLFIVLVIGLIIVTFTLFLPTLQNMGKYNADHASAVAQIDEYKNVIANQASVEARIAQLEEQYKENLSIYVNVETSVNDLQKMFADNGVHMSSLTRSVGTKDSKNRTAKSGYPLYYTTLNFTFESSLDKAGNIVKYLEQDSNGCYFINTLTMTPMEGSSNYLCNFNVTLYYFDTSKGVVTTAATSTTAKKK
ncbi:MAG: hypothetical protein MJ089_03655 [Ruminococcus sp.]|nr:hypothetical protein [Ruminococcus sp.]